MFNYTQESTKNLTIFNDGKIVWPWGTERPTDKLTCADDGYECPENGEFLLGEWELGLTVLACTVQVRNLSE